MRDKDHFKDDGYGMPSDSILEKKDTFYGPSTTNSQAASNLYPTPNITQISLLEPQKIEQSGFLGEAGEVSYDEGLSWHPVKPIKDNGADNLNTAGAIGDLSSFDTSDAIGAPRGILRTSRRDPEGGVANGVDCDINAQGTRYARILQQYCSNCG